MQEVSQMYFLELKIILAHCRANRRKLRSLIVASQRDENCHLNVLSSVFSEYMYIYIVNSTLYIKFVFFYLILL
jgi:hypothetical protein